MRIVADADILAIDAGFSAFGELTLVPGRKISPEIVRTADALLVRSITPVNGDLLSGSSVKFVGTATSGIDHVDNEYLQQQGIHFAHAGGSNANAVTDYCFTALSQLLARQQSDPLDRTVAIIGAGNVGRLFASKLRAIGFRCGACDPLLSSAELDRLTGEGVEVIDLKTALRADIVSLHVPLTLDGPHPTFHLLGAAQLEALAPNAILINTSRGPVVNNRDLQDVLRDRGDIQVVLDVWENEPSINVDLLTEVALATPHIAGYSIEAKLSATAGLQQQFCDFFQINREPHSDLVPDSQGVLPVPEVETPGAADWFCSSVLDRVFPIVDLDRQLRAGLCGRRAQQARSNTGTAASEDYFTAEAEYGLDGSVVFDRLRRQLVSRHEFRAFHIKQGGLSSRQSNFLRLVGFSISPH